MRIFWIKIPKEIQWIVTLLILWVLFWLYKNLALVSIIILSIIFIILFFIWLFKLLNLDNYFDNTYWKIIWTIFILLSFIPWYFWWYMIMNYDESNKYLQEKSFEWFIQIWQFAVKWRSFTARNIINELETNMVEDLKEKAVIETVNNLWKNMSNWNIKTPIIEPNATFESWVIKLNPEIRFVQ